MTSCATISSARRSATWPTACRRPTRTTRRALGNLTVHAEAARDTMRWRWLDELTQDVSHGLRTLRRAPTFVVGVVATIGRC
ncbi:MAG TPA: hypothetical protein VGQ44_22965 [Gemmatimonadaceae bacterium]|nr:hypothetical protein [Gemmatimonadaceae bacterium]